MAEIRGGAPASRELALLEPVRTVERLDAVLLTGGSAFGLAAVDGVIRWCEERGSASPPVQGRADRQRHGSLRPARGGTGRYGPAPPRAAACVASAAGPVELGSAGSRHGVHGRGKDVTRPDREASARRLSATRPWS